VVALVASARLSVQIYILCSALESSDHTRTISEFYDVPFIMYKNFNLTVSSASISHGPLFLGRRSIFQVCIFWVFFRSDHDWSPRLIASFFIVDRDLLRCIGSIHSQVNLG
jgi:hypothetical protein